MKLLLLTPQLPYPPHQGTSLRNYHIMRGLAEEHSLYLLSFVDPETKGEIADPLASLCAEIVAVEMPQRSSTLRLWQMTFSGQADMALRLHSTPYATALQALLTNVDFDIVQIEGIELAWTIPIIRSTRPDVPIVYDAHNAEALLQARAGEADRPTIRRWPAAAYSWLQSRRLSAYESWVCRSVEHVTAVSEADRTALKRLAPESEITVIPNCIDVQAYENLPAALVGEPSVVAPDVLFMGKMDYRPNVDAVLWFADHIWPLILERQPHATWTIVGQKPHARLAHLGHLPAVTLTGWVPETAPYLANSKVFIMPFRIGSGTRLKLIEAMAAGKAIVSTSVGAEGFPIVDGRELVIADSEQAFATAVVDLLADEQLRQRLGQAGQEFAADYDWRTVVPRFQQVYAAISK